MMDLSPDNMVHIFLLCISSHLDCMLIIMSHVIECQILFFGFFFLQRLLNCSSRQLAYTFSIFFLLLLEFSLGSFRADFYLGLVCLMPDVTVLTTSI